MHTLARFCESQRRFSLFFPLNIYISLFFRLSALSLLPCSSCSLLHSPGARPSAPLSPVFLACLPSACPLSIGRALKLSGGLLCVVPCVFCCPSLVSHQAQNSVTVWADAARICPRPFVLLPPCCRVFRCSFRGFRPSVSVCVLLPCVVRRQ